MGDPANPIDPAAAALLRAIVDDADAADDAALNQADQAQRRLDAAWGEGMRTWTLAGPPAIATAAKPAAEGAKP